MGRANARPMTGSAKQSRKSYRGDGLDCFVALLLAMTSFYATSAITIGMVIAARIVCSVMIWASKGASPPSCRAIT